MPTYAVIFRIRADAKELKKREPKAGLREYDAGTLPADGRAVRPASSSRTASTAFDIWNHQTIDESAQEVMMHMADMKLI